jgi:CDP-glycerol glycerophosphotransferase (TagB/SpsB family)
MKDKIDLIFSDLKNEVITEKQAHQQVLDLFAVMPSLPSDDIVREAANNYAFNRYYEQKNPYDTTVTDFEEGIRWIRRYIKRQCC